MTASSFFLPLALFLLGISTVPIGWAQHDAPRDAVQFLADGKINKIGKELRGADPFQEHEVTFVRMMKALHEGDLDTATQLARKAIEAGLPIERFVAGPRALLSKLDGHPDFAALIEQHPPSPLIHGPMVGSITDQSAAFWVRTANAATVEIRSGDLKSTPVKTSAASDFTAVLSLNDLEANTDYPYEVLIDGQPIAAENTSFTTSPTQGKPAKFTVGFGGGAGYVPIWERMWDTIDKADPHAFFMLGDNVYIDQPEHSLAHYYCYYRRQSRPEWRRFTAGTSIFAIYDDHDFGTNDCNPGPKIDTPAWKRPVWEIFRQNWVNPAYGGGQENPGCWFDTQIADVHFIFLDGRFYRDRKGGSMLGPVQKKWLFETLSNSDATFKVILTPVPFTPNIKPGSKDPWDGFPEEREEIFSLIEEKNVEGVFLVSADRHRTDLRIIDRPNGYDLYEFESSRLTNKHTHKVVETPGLVWGYNKTCSFGLMEFDTTANDPTVTMKAISIDGELIHSHVLPLSKLQR